MGNLRFLVSVGLLLCCIEPFLAGQPSRAEVVPDKTGVGTKVDKPLNKPNYYDITGGKKFGKNLLHSFLQFSLSKGWTAEFSSLPPGIRNIISRVTGPDASNIDGTLKVGGTGINLFLLNPNGIIFGPNAKLDLSGSFLASTAESIKFSGGSVFSAKPEQDQLLTLGVPAGLQFGANPGSITGNFTNPTQTDFMVKEGETLALVGGDVTLHGRDVPNDNIDFSNKLLARNGRIEIGSVAGGETVGILFPQKNFSFALDFSNTKSFNNIRIDQGLFVGAGNADVFVYGDNIDLAEGARLGGSIFSTDQFGSIFVLASGLLTLDDSNIRTTSADPSTDWDIEIQAQDINLKNGSSISADPFPVNFNSSPKDFTKLQKGGDIKISTHHLDLEESKITSSIINPNNQNGLKIKKGIAGNIEINSESIRLNNQSEILAEAKNRTMKFNPTVSLGGNITLHHFDNTSGLQDVILQNGSRISAFGGNKGGTVDITSNAIFLDQSEIFAKSQLGDGGTINLDVKNSLILRNKGKISTSATEGGMGGEIVINAGAIAAVLGEGSFIRATTGTGKGGSIKINTQGIFGLEETEGGAKGEEPEGIGAFVYTGSGNDGSVRINRLATNTVFNFTESPPQLQKQPLEAVCFDNQRGDKDSFVNSGRGGLPVNPSEPIVSQALWQDLRTTPLSTTRQPQTMQGQANVNIPMAENQTSEPPNTNITEAQGWVTEPDGTVKLVASVATANGANSPSQPCLATEPTAPASILGSSAGRR